MQVQIVGSSTPGAPGGVPWRLHVAQGAVTLGKT